MHQRLLTIALLTTALAACGNDDADSDACFYDVCAIAEPACAEEVAAVVACKRNENAPAIPVRFVTGSALVAEWNAKETPPTAEELQNQSDALRAEALVGLMPEGYQASELTADFVRNYVAFYSSDDKEIVIIEDQAPSDPMDAYLTLVHETIHAFQDARWDLLALSESFATTVDRRLGEQALVEGEAMLYPNLAAVELLHLSERDVQWSAYYADLQANALELASQTETPLVDARAYFPYAYGSEFVFDAYQRGASRVDELYGRPPDSVRQVMAGFGGWPDGHSNGDATLDPHAVPIMPANYIYLSGGHEGVWIINAMLQRTAGTGLWTDELSGVSADYMVELADSTSGEVSIVWRIQSDHPHDLVGALVAHSQWRLAGGPTMPAGYLVTVFDGDVVLVASSGGDASSVLADVMGWQRPYDAFPADDGNAAVAKLQRAHVY